MKLNLKLAQRLFLLATPLLTGSVCAASPSMAATFAYSEGAAYLDNFSHNPESVAAIADTYAYTQLINRGAVNTNANAFAAFIPNSDASQTVALNSSVSTANGEGLTYLGIAKSSATVIGYDFLVGAGESFSFDFQALLNLETSIDNPPNESANADGSVSFQVFDSTDAENWNLLDFFTVSGKLTTLGNEDFLQVDNSASVAIDPNNSSFDRSFGGTQESTTGYVTGRYSRAFDTLTKLTLIEAKKNNVSVKVPESSNLLGLILFGLICLGYKAKRLASH